MNEIYDKLKNIFQKIQFNKRNHPEHLSKLKKLYEEANKSDFDKAFRSCLLVAFDHAEKHLRVENVLDFATKFAINVGLITSENDEEELGPFLNSLFSFLLTNSDVEDTALRFRVCYFMSALLNSMGVNTVINDDLFDKITTCMIERLLDKVPKIRAQAIFALGRLQDKTNENCPVIRAFIFHLSKDPQAEVRRAVLLTIGKNKHTLAAVLRRTRDINGGVRLLAYKFLSKITVKSFTIAQREQLLRDGLHDRFEKVSKYVGTQLLPIWLKYYEGSFEKLLRALDAEKSLDISSQMLKVLLKDTPLRDIIEHLSINEDTKLIPIEKLTSENVIYWSCTIEHLRASGFQDELEKILPDLLKFCAYVREFMGFMKANSRELWELETLRFILVQLFKITKFYDLSDEVGRENLKELILDTLKSDINSEILIDCVIQQFVAIVPNIEVRLDLLADVISGLRMPMTVTKIPLSEAEVQEKKRKKVHMTVELLQAEEELFQATRARQFLKADQLDQKINILKRVIDELSEEPIQEVEQEEEIVLKDDKETLTKCLGIMFSLMQSVKTLYPFLTSLFEDMVLPSLDHPAESVIVLALKTTAVFCLLNENLAKKYLPVFLIQFSMENDNIWLVALKGIFDLLLQYGLESLGVAPSSSTNDYDKANKSCRNKHIKLHNQSDDNELQPILSRPSFDKENKNIISVLIELLDNVNQDIRTITVEGFCKLLLHRRIASASLLSRLIILWHNPVTNGDTYMHQCLSYFFNHFIFLVPESKEMFQQSFLPTLKILANAPDTSPLQEIEPLKVAHLILQLTKHETQNQPLAYCAHNDLAFAIISEALNVDSDIDSAVLIRTLRYVDVNLEDELTRKLLQESVEKLWPMVKTTDKRTIKALLGFKNSLCQHSEETVEDEQPSQNSSITPEIS